MVTPSRKLMDEHDSILIGLDILEKMTVLIQDGKQVEINDIEEMLNFLKLFADKSHHGKEEDILFPAMEKAGIPNERGPIGQMLIEHNQGRVYIKEMGESIQEGNLAKNEFIQAAINYINLLRAHIKKENMVLFPMGDKMIPADEQEEISVRFKEWEENILGAENLAKMH
ncbi:MAG: hemerythrin [Syntrophomonadaceae bacterium]|nr:hemerythrin [Syntrophomonadaceae bacterium]